MTRSNPSRYLLLVLALVGLSLPSPCTAAESSTETIEGAFDRIGEREEDGKTVKVGFLRTAENRELGVPVSGPGAILLRLTRGDVVEIQYEMKGKEPIILRAAQVKRGHFDGILEQIDGKSSIKVEAGTQSNAILLPAGPLDLAKGHSPGDTIEGTFTQDGLDKPKFAQAIWLKRAEVGIRSAALFMALGIFVFLVVAMILLKGGGSKLRKLVIGGDGRTSNSKTQATVWFGIVLASYIALLGARIWHGGWAYVGGIDIPQNLLLLSGISAGTFVGSKLLTANRVASGIPKPAAAGAHPADLFTNDCGQFDLGDFQMFAWALLAAGVYVLQMLAFLLRFPLSASISLPDVDSTLLSFFGIGQGAYLVKKGFAEVQGKVTGIAPPQAAAGAIVAISGSGFGEATGYVRFGTAMARVIAWRDGTISVEIPGVSPGEFPVQVSLPPLAAGGREVPLQPVSFRVVAR